MILTNQFHDIIPGSSIHEVYEDSRRDYEKVRKIGEEVAAEAEEAMTEVKSQTDSLVEGTYLGERS